MNIEQLKAQQAYSPPTLEEIIQQQQAEIEALKAELRGIDELITGKSQEK